LLYSDRRKCKAKKIDRAVPRQIHAVYANSGGTLSTGGGGGGTIRNLKVVC